MLKKWKSILVKYLVSMEFNIKNTKTNRKKIYNDSTWWSTKVIDFRKIFVHFDWSFYSSFPIIWTIFPKFYLIFVFIICSETFIYACNMRHMIFMLIKGDFFYVFSFLPWHLDVVITADLRAEDPTNFWSWFLLFQTVF